MPGGNKTGPAGAGPMTGRAAGFCAGYGLPGYANPTGGRGFCGSGRGRGFGRGMGFGRNAGFSAGPYAGAYNLTVEQELEALKEQVRFFEGSLEQAKERIEELYSRNK